MSSSSLTHPGTSVALALLGGLVYLGVAVLVAIVGGVAAFIGIFPALAVAGTVAGLVIVGVLTLVFAFLLRLQPNLALVWGVILVVLALVSLALVYGGLVAGFLLTLVAGILAITGQIAPMIHPSGQAQ